MTTKIRRSLGGAAIALLLVTGTACGGGKAGGDPSASGNPAVTAWEEKSRPVLDNVADLTGYVLGSTGSTACLALASDAKEAKEAVLPAPDRLLTLHVTNYLDALKEAGEDCTLQAFAGRTTNLSDVREAATGAVAIEERLEELGAASYEDAWVDVDED